MKNANTLFQPSSALLRPVGDTRSVEECVAGTVVAMELVGLAELAQHRLDTIHLLAVRVLVIVSEQAKQRAAQLLAQVDRRQRTLGVELALIVDDHVAAPATHRGVDIRKGAGGEIGVAPARAKADHADLAVRVGLRAQKLHASPDVAHDLLVGHPTRRAHPRPDIVGAARPFAKIKVRRDGHKSMIRQLAGCLLDPLIPPRHVMDQHHARPRTGAKRPGIIGLARVIPVADERHGFRQHSFVGHCSYLDLQPRSCRSRAAMRERGSHGHLCSTALYVWS